MRLATTPCSPLYSKHVSPDRELAALSRLCAPRELTSLASAMQVAARQDVGTPLVGKASYGPAEGQEGFSAGISASSEVLKSTDPPVSSLISTRSSAEYKCTRSGMSAHC